MFVDDMKDENTDKIFLQNCMGSLIELNACMVGRLNKIVHIEIKGLSDDFLIIHKSNINVI